MSFKKASPIFPEIEGTAAAQLAPLSDLPLGQEGIVQELLVEGPTRKRLLQLGLVPGAHVTNCFAAPGGDPLVFSVDGCQLALRKDIAAQIYVIRKTPAGK